MISLETTTSELFVCFVIESLLVIVVVFDVLFSKKASIVSLLIAFLSSLLLSTTLLSSNRFSKSELFLFDFDFDFLFALFFSVLATKAFSEFVTYDDCFLKLFFPFLNPF